MENKVRPLVFRVKKKLFKVIETRFVPAHLYLFAAFRLTASLKGTIEQFLQINIQ